MGSFGKSNSNALGTAKAYFDANGNLIFLGTAAPNNITGIGERNAPGDLELSVPANRFIMFGIGGVNSNDSFAFNAAGVNVFAGVNTAGLGVPAIYTAYPSGSQNAALTAVGSYTPPATAGRYRVTANVYCTVGTTTTFSVKVNYKDLNGTAHADILPLVSAAAPGVFLTNGLVIAAGTYYAMPIEIDIDNSQTPITFSTVGTFTTVTYFLNTTLEQLS